MFWLNNVFVLQKNIDIHYWEAECFKIDAENKKVFCRPSKDGNLNGNEEIVVDYDYLVVAMGARANTFNTPGVEENCLFLKVTFYKSRVDFSSTQLYAIYIEE